MKWCLLNSVVVAVCRRHIMCCYCVHTKLVLYRTKWIPRDDEEGINPMLDAQNALKKGICRPKNRLAQMNHHNTSLYRTQTDQSNPKPYDPAFFPTRLQPYFPFLSGGLSPKHFDTHFEASRNQGIASASKHSLSSTRQDVSRIRWRAIESALR